MDKCPTSRIKGKMLQIWFLQPPTRFTWILWQMGSMVKPYRQNTQAYTHTYIDPYHELLSSLQNSSHCWVSASYSHQYGVFCSLLWTMYISPPPIKTSKTTIFHSLCHKYKMWAETFELQQFDIINSFILLRCMSCLLSSHKFC